MRKWIFDFSPNAEYKGLADSGIETFKDHPIKSLAREVCQNSLDAVLEGNVAEVEFKLFEINRNEFPGVDSLQESIIKAERYWGQGKEKTFLNTALTILNQPKIKFLRISDFNTTGLTGINDDNVQNSRWLKLIRASGVSTKAGKSGGSFGIGKFASFACSNLRSVFYNTKNVDNEIANLGVARLFSFAESSGNICDGRAFCGIDLSSSPEEQLLNLDKSFTRTTTGTDIYISAFNDNPFWRGELVSSIIDSFLIAISQGKLQVKIQDEILNDKTLDSMFKKYKDDFTTSTKNAYEVLTSDKSQDIKIVIPEYGYLQLKILQDSKLNKKISMIKSMGMKITDYSYNGHIYFSAICVIEGNRLNETLLKMENPAHNNWSSERMDTIQEKRNADKLLRDMREAIINKINELFIDKDLEEINIDGLDILQQMDDVADKNSEIGHGFNDTINKVEVTTKEVLKAILSNKYKTYGDEIEIMERDNQATIIEDDEESDSGRTSDGSGKSNKKTGEGSNDKGHATNGDESVKRAVSIKSRKTRMICLNKEKAKYRLIFQPVEDAFNGFFVIYKVDEQGSLSELFVKSATLNGEPLKTFNNRILGVNFNSAESIKLDVEFIDKEYYSLEVRAYANKE
ncbi:MAG: hypothetical protein AB7S44_04250 [Spirochaetales bacterium]